MLKNQSFHGLVILSSETACSHPVLSQHLINRAHKDKKSAVNPKQHHFQIIIEDLASLYYTYEASYFFSSFHIHGTPFTLIQDSGVSTMNTIPLSRTTESEISFDFALSQDSFWFKLSV